MNTHPNSLKLEVVFRKRVNNLVNNESIVNVRVCIYGYYVRVVCWFRDG